MQGEAVLGDEDALEVGLTLGALWRARWAAVLVAPTSRPTPTSTPRPTASRHFCGVCSSSTSRRDSQTEDHRIEQRSDAHTGAPGLSGQP